jgi:hypothetical protein
MMVETAWFRNRTSAMLHEVGIQRNRAHAVVEVDRKINLGEYHIGAGPTMLPGEVAREWDKDGRLVIQVREAA